MGTGKRVVLPADTEGTQQTEDIEIEMVSVEEVSVEGGMLGRGEEPHKLTDKT